MAKKGSAKKALRVMHVNKFESLVIYFAMKLPISDWTLHNSPVIKSDTKNFLYQLKKNKRWEALANFFHQTRKNKHARLHTIIVSHFPLADDS